MKVKDIWGGSRIWSVEPHPLWCPFFFWKKYENVEMGLGHRERMALGSGRTSPLQLSIPGVRTMQCWLREFVNLRIPGDWPRPVCPWILDPLCQECGVYELKRARDHKEIIRPLDAVLSTTNKRCCGAWADLEASEVEMSVVALARGPGRDHANVWKH